MRRTVRTTEGPPTLKQAKGISRLEERHPLLSPLSRPLPFQQESQSRGGLQTRNAVSQSIHPQTSYDMTVIETLEETLRPHSETR